MRSEVNDKLEVRIYAEGQDAPIIFQPDYPDGTPFEDRAHAQAWADQWIKNNG